MSPLHFGNFAGILSKAVWFGLGFAMCYVTLTGLRLWLARRGPSARSLSWLDRVVMVVGFGLPFALVVAAAAFLVAMPLGRAVFWPPAAFLIRSEEHTSELQSLMRISYAVFCLKKKS